MNTTLETENKSLLKEKRDKASTVSKTNRELLDQKIKLVKERAENTVQLGFEKAVAHLENPGMYPLPSGDKTVERAFYNLLISLPELKQNKIIDKINQTLKASSSVRTNKYKDIVNVNFNSTVSIAEQVKAMTPPDELKFTEVEGTKIAEIFSRSADKPGQNVNGNDMNKTSAENKQIFRNAAEPQLAGVSASKVSFFVDNMTCLNPDDVRKDEINLAGFSIDSLGNNVALSPFFVGKFRKNETVNLGDKSKLFTINIDPNLIAQSFVAGLFIIESDLISNPDTVNKLITLFLAICGTVILVTLALIAISVLAVPIVTPFVATVLIGIGLSFQAIGLQIIPLLGDDISFEVTDTLAIADKVDIGETFPRTLTIGKGFDINSTFDGKYTAAARWVGEA
ncbi:MAG: hypothetical protein ABI543_07960 [Ignavibacteria bacterium]